MVVVRILAVVAGMALGALVAVGFVVAALFERDGSAIATARRARRTCSASPWA